MEAHVGHLHCRYRIRSGEGSAAALATGLDDVARSQLPQAFGGALDRMLGDDPAVYVIRTMTARVRLALRGGDSMQEVAERWALQMARSIAEEIAEDNGSNVIRFRNKAEFVARFLADLVRGEAWNRWYFGAFARLRQRGDKEALRSMLLDQPVAASEVLGELSRLGSLTSVLAALDPADREDLWNDRLGARRPPDPDALRPVFAAAITLIGHLALWTAARPADEALFQAYLDGNPPPVDWRNSEGLAAAVYDAVRFLVETDQLTKPLGADLEALSSRLDSAVADFDWLDQAWLQTSLAELFAGPAPNQELVAAPRPRQPTPKHRSLVQNLETVVSAERLNPPLDGEARTAAALRLYGALVAKFPEWTGDPLAVDVIDRVVRAGSSTSGARPGDGEATSAAGPRTSRSALTPTDDGSIVSPMPIASTIGSPPSDDGNRATGHPADAPTDCGPADGEDAVAAVARPVITKRAGERSHLFSGLSESERELVRRLTGTEGDAPIIETDCAGIFLLLRPILDLRLPTLFATIKGLGAEAISPTASALVALAIRWAGEATSGVAAIDPGLSLFAGLTTALCQTDLAKAWSTAKVHDLDRCQRSLCRSLAGQRMMAPSHLHLFGIQHQDGTSLLVATDATAVLWPLGAAVEGAEHAGEVAIAWLAFWQEATGVRPTVVVGDELAELGERLARWGARIGAHEALVEDPAQSALLHVQGRRALGAALAALAAGRVGLPAVDLFLDLVAALVLRAWSRWMKGLSQSSVPYLMDSFIRRPGRIAMDASAIDVVLPRRGLDLVVEMAGYAQEYGPVSWLGGRRVRYRLEN